MPIAHTQIGSSPTSDRKERALLVNGVELSGGRNMAQRVSIATDGPIVLPTTARQVFVSH